MRVEQLSKSTVRPVPEVARGLEPCPVCDFGIWIPVARLPHTQIGLYSDARFPGRCIASFEQHYEQLDELPFEAMTNFMTDISKCVTAIKSATGAERVNVAVLGNQESHVHAHLIPRFPSQEPFPSKAPWEDSREKGTLTTAKEDELVDKIRFELSGATGATTVPSPRLRRRRSAARGQTLFGILPEA